MMAQEALTRGLTMNQAKGHAMAAMDQAYGSGSGMLPPLPGTEHCTQWAKEFEQKLFPPKSHHHDCCPMGNLKCHMPFLGRHFMDGPDVLPHTVIAWITLHLIC